MTTVERLIADRLYVTRHARFVGSETSGPFGEVTRVLWREPNGRMARTPAGPTSLAWAVARACLESADEGLAAEAQARARALAFTDEERA